MADMHRAMPDHEQGLGLVALREDQVIPVESPDGTLAAEFVKLFGREVLEKINILQQLNAH